MNLSKMWKLIMRWLAKIISHSPIEFEIENMKASRRYDAAQSSPCSSLPDRFFGHNFATTLRVPSTASPSRKARVLVLGMSLSAETFSANAISRTKRFLQLNDCPSNTLGLGLRPVVMITFSSFGLRCKIAKCNRGGGAGNLI